MSALRLPLDERFEALSSKRWGILRWTSSLPFLENTRGVLIHRPRGVNTYSHKGKATHIGVGFWCGNSVAGGNTLAFLSDVPAGKLLCAVCEARAVLSGLPSADSICGRHVHLGRVVAQQTCCSRSPGEKA